MKEFATLVIVGLLAVVGLIYATTGMFEHCPKCGGLLNTTAATNSAYDFHFCPKCGYTDSKAWNNQGKEWHEKE